MDLVKHLDHKVSQHLFFASHRASFDRFYVSNYKIILVLTLILFIGGIIESIIEKKTYVVLKLRDGFKKNAFGFK